MEDDFSIVVQRDYGGALLNPLLEFIVESLDTETESVASLDTPWI